MPQAPFIPCYELQPDGTSTKHGTLCGPDEVFALAAAMSYEETNFCLTKNDDKTFDRAIMFFYDRVKKTPPAMMGRFDWYCKACAEAGVITGKAEWQEKPQDFSKRVRAYLVLLLFSGMNLDANSVVAHWRILKMYDKVIADLYQDWDRPTPLFLKILRVIFFPIGLYSRWFSPRHTWDLEKKQIEKALALNRKLIALCEQVLNNQKVFTFETPKDQLKKRVVIDGLSIATDSDGTVIMG